MKPSEIKSSAQPFTEPVMPGLSIKVANLSKRFNREWIFRNLTYQFTAGNIYAITGPNGSGKSTLLQALSGFIPQTGGELHYNLNGTELPVEDIWKHIAFAGPYMDLIEEFTLEEQVRFHFRMKKPRLDIDVQGAIERMQLSRASTKFIGNFSSGMRQRVKLALAFYTEGPAILLDEPGTNLDSSAFEWYLGELEKLPRECLVVVASNNSEEYPKNAGIVNIIDYK